MDDLISRQEAIKHLKKRLIETAINNVGAIARCDSIFEDTADNRIGPWLNELPSAQPERKRGRWTLIGMKKYKTVGRTPDQKEVLLEKEWRREEKIQCSCCGEITMLDYSITYQFCPHCGADMREDNHETD